MKAYRNAFPESQKSQLDRKEHGKTLRKAMDLFDFVDSLAVLHPAAEGKSLI